MTQAAQTFPYNDDFVLVAHIDNDMHEEFATANFGTSKISTLPISELSSVYPYTIEFMQPIKNHILNNRGAVYVKNASQYFTDKAQVRDLYLLMSRAIGNLNRLYGDLYDVRYKKPAEGQKITVSQTSGFSPMHTDGSWLLYPPQAIGLLCLTAAMEGGESLLIHTHKLRQAIQELSADVLQVLQQPFYRESASPGFDASKEHVLSCKFRVVHDCVGWSGIQYMRRWIDEGHTKVGKPLNNTEISALNLLDKLLTDPALTIEIPTQKFDILLMNNQTVLHTRKPFNDSEIVDEKRVMVRAWIDGDPREIYNYPS